MPESENTELAKYRLEKAKNSLNSAKLLLDDNYYADSANRSYYAFFHAINALFALSGKGFKKHSGVITNFGIDYIKTGLIEPEYGRIANYAFKVRTKSDYSDFYFVTKTDVEEQYVNAVKFVNKIETFITGSIS